MNNLSMQLVDDNDVDVARVRACPPSARVAPEHPLLQYQCTAVVERRGGHRQCGVWSETYRADIAATLLCDQHAHLGPSVRRSEGTEHRTRNIRVGEL